MIRNLDISTLPDSVGETLFTIDSCSCSQIEVRAWQHNHTKKNVMYLVKVHVNKIAYTNILGDGKSSYLKYLFIFKTVNF